MEIINKIIQFFTVMLFIFITLVIINIFYLLIERYILIKLIKDIASRELEKELNYKYDYLLHIFSNKKLMDEFQEDLFTVFNLMLTDLNHLEDLVNISMKDYHNYLNLLEKIKENTAIETEIFEFIGLHDKYITIVKHLNYLRSNNKNLKNNVMATYSDFIKTVKRYEIKTTK